MIVLFFLSNLLSSVLYIGVNIYLLLSLFLYFYFISLFLSLFFIVHYNSAPLILKCYLYEPHLVCLFHLFLHSCLAILLILVSHAIFTCTIHKGLIPLWSYFIAFIFNWYRELHTVLYLLFVLSSFIKYKIIFLFNSYPWPLAIIAFVVSYAFALGCGKTNSP